MSGRIEDRLRGLQLLPELEPPADSEARVLSAMGEAANVARRPRSFGRTARAAGWVAAAGVGALLTIWTVNQQQVDDALDRDSAGTNDEIFFQLAEESARLEELLVLLPESRRVMRGDTASTIVGLENWITLIDAELYGASTQAIGPEYRTALMQDRVEAMNALVNVRYAQSRAFIY